MTDNKLYKKDLAILDFLRNSKSGITVKECQMLFGTSEWRKVASKFRRNGIALRRVVEHHPEGWHYRYFIDEG